MALAPAVGCYQIDAVQGNSSQECVDIFLDVKYTAPPTPNSSPSRGEERIQTTCLLVARRCRQRDDKLRAFPLLTLHSNGAAMGFDAFLEGGQAQTAAAWAQREEGFEDLLLHFRRHADAGINEA